MKVERFFSKYNKVFIILFFLVLTVFLVIPLSKYGRIAITSDGGFHFSRAEEIYKNLKEGSFFTFIATHTFHHTGVGSFLFYPDIFLYPWAFLRFLLDPVKAYYAWYGLMTFLTLLFAYGSMLSYSKKNVRSIIFALVYTLAGYRLYLGTWNYVLGEFIAVTFLPIAFVGFYHVFWGDHKKWYLLSIGVALLAYSHLLSLTITIVIFTILAIVKIIIAHAFSKQRLTDLVKSICLATGLSLFVLIPFITDFLSAGLYTPGPGIYFVGNLGDVFLRSLSNIANVQYSTGIVILFTAVFGWLFVRGEKRAEKIIYTLGIAVLAMSTSFFPWHYFLHTPIAVIQFPYRLLSFASLFLAVTASLIASKVLNNINAKRSLLLLFGVTFFIYVGYLGSLQPAIARIEVQNNLFLAKAPSDGNAHTLPDGSQVNKNNYNRLFGYGVHFGETDYFPIKSRTEDNVNSILKQNVFADGQTTKSEVSSGANKANFKVSLTKKDKIDLPIIRYKHTYVYLNHKPVKMMKNHRGTVSIMGKKGVNNIVVGYKASSPYYWSLFLALICWIGIVFIIIL